MADGNNNNENNEQKKSTITTQVKNASKTGAKKNSKTFIKIFVTSCTNITYCHASLCFNFISS